MVSILTAGTRHNPIIKPRDRILRHGWRMSAIWAAFDGAMAGIVSLLVVRAYSLTPSDFAAQLCGVLGNTKSCTGVSPVGPAMVSIAFLVCMIIPPLIRASAKKSTRVDICEKMKLVGTAMVKEGFRRPQIPTLAVIILMSAVFIFDLSASYLYEQFSRILGESYISPHDWQTDHVPQMLIIIFIVTVVAPLSEEFIFRGIMIRWLLLGVKFLGPVRVFFGGGSLIARSVGFPGLGSSRVAMCLAIVIVGLVFGFMHPLGQAIPSSIIGMSLAWLRLATGSLWPCVIVHAGWNALAIGLMYA